VKFAAAVNGVGGRMCRREICVESHLPKPRRGNALLRKNVVGPNAANASVILLGGVLVSRMVSSMGLKSVTAGLWFERNALQIIDAPTTVMATSPQGFQ
jgi:hypothetical protein